MVRATRSTRAPAKKAAASSTTGKGKGKYPSRSKKSATTKTSAARKSTQSTSATTPRKYTKWLIKSEPDSRIVNGIDAKFSFDDLKAEPNQTAFWDGVRNYQARGFLRDQMKKGHQAFFYHSNCKQPGIVGVVDITRDGYPDHTAFDKKDLHYDPKSDPAAPRWFMVDVKYKRDLKRLISLDELKTHKTGALSDMFLLRSSRLSVSPVSDEEWDFILSLE